MFFTARLLACMRSGLSVSAHRHARRCCVSEVNMQRAAQREDDGGCAEGLLGYSAAAGTHGTIPTIITASRPLALCLLP